MTTPSKTQQDRFIPSRTAMDMESAHFRMVRDSHMAQPASPSAKAVEVVSPSKEEYKRRLARGLLESNGGDAGQQGKMPAKILAFKNKAPSMAEGLDNANLSHIYSAYNGPQPNKKKQFRPIPTAPERILDAPELLDDYYLNLLDWSSDNVVAVALPQFAVETAEEAGEIVRAREELAERSHEQGLLGGEDLLDQALRAATLVVRVLSHVFQHALLEFRTTDEFVYQAGIHIN